MEGEKRKLKKLSSMPIISANILEALCKIISNNHAWQRVFIPWLSLAVSQMIRLGVDKYEKYFEGCFPVRPADVPDEEWSVLTKALNEIKANIREAVAESKRTYYSEDDVVDAMIKEKCIPAKLLKAMLGGKWPKTGFGFDHVSFYTMVDGRLVPGNEEDDIPGPDFQFVSKKINDPSEGL
jgi:hypothetical protein